MSDTVEAPADTPQEPTTAQFKGETFRLNPDVSEWALMEFAEAADAGEDANEFRGMASLLRFILEIVHDDDRDRFRAVARRAKASSDDLLEFIGIKVTQDAERPTVRPSDSTDGPSSIGQKFESSSEGKDSPPVGLDLTKRPDLALIVVDSQRARAS